MKDILLKIVGKQIFDDIEDSGAEGQEEEQQIEFVTEGKLFQRSGNTYVVYEESDFSGMAGCKTTIKVTPQGVHMKRIGEAGTAIEFEKGRRYEGIYETPYGNMELEVLTNSVTKNMSQDGLGTINVDYSLTLKGVLETRNTLCIEVKENNA